MRLLILAITVILVCEALGNIHEKWQHHIHKHNKTFCNETHELESRKKFEKIDRLIELHNQEASEGKKSFFLEHNMFSSEILDSPTDFKGIIPLSKTYSYGIPEETYKKKGGQLPDTFDWRNYGLLNTPVRRQGSCGSCWAFSSTASIEAQYAIKKKIQVTLSPQELIDCSATEFKTIGCNGGHVPFAFGYIMKYGITDEASYKYAYERSSKNFKDCPANITSMIRYKISGITRIPNGDVEALKEALYTQGPIAIGVDSTSTFFQYKKGIWDGSSPKKEGGYCSTTINHAVLLVGYGKNSDGVRYWIIKNQWGPNWGEEGYIKILDNGTNICGIASYAWFPNL